MRKPKSKTDRNYVNVDKCHMMRVSDLAHHYLMEARERYQAEVDSNPTDHPALAGTTISLSQTIIALCLMAEANK